MNIGLLGTALVMGIAAIGSGIGVCIAGKAAIGAWKKCYMGNKAAPFILTVFQVLLLHRQSMVSF